MDEVTIQKIRARLVRAITALEDALDADLVGADGMHLLRPITAYLIRTELGREPTYTEVSVVLDRIGESFGEDATNGGEP